MGSGEDDGRDERSDKASQGDHDALQCHQGATQMRRARFRDVNGHRRRRPALTQVFFFVVRSNLAAETLETSQLKCRPSVRP